MPRKADAKVKGFIWLPREDVLTHDIHIGSVSVKDRIWSAEFTRAVSPEIGYFKITLDNNNEEFTGKYADGTAVGFYMDFSDGTTTRFKGEIDMIKNKYGSNGFTLEISGNHVSGEIMGITVTESYAGTMTCDEILKDMIAKYLTGYTYTNVAASTVSPTINWNNKPFWDCVEDLCRLASPTRRFDCYADDDKDFHFFEEGSIENANEAIVWNYTMIDTEGLGTQSLTKRNKIIVYGDDGEGLPIISTSGTGTKEEVIFDSKITSEIQAVERSVAQLLEKNQDQLEGKARAFILPSLSPGDKIWITNPVFKIHGQYKVYKYTHSFPEERTECFIQTSRDVPSLFKRMIENELALQPVTNPFKMVGSLNLKFDSYSELATNDGNVYVSEGKVKLNSGAEGTFTAKKTLSSAITFIHLKVIGSSLVGTTYQVSTDGGDTFTSAIPEFQVAVPSGTSLILKVKINSAVTEIDSIALLYR